MAFDCRFIGCFSCLGLKCRYFEYRWISTLHASATMHLLYRFDATLSSVNTVQIKIYWYSTTKWDGSNHISSLRLDTTKHFVWIYHILLLSPWVESNRHHLPDPKYQQTLAKMFSYEIPLLSLKKIHLIFLCCLCTSVFLLLFCLYLSPYFFLIRVCVFFFCFHVHTRAKIDYDGEKLCSSVQVYLTTTTKTVERLRLICC